MTTQHLTHADRAISSELLHMSLDSHMTAPSQTIIGTMFGPLRTRAHPQATDAHVSGPKQLAMLRPEPASDYSSSSDVETRSESSFTSATDCDSPPGDSWTNIQSRPHLSPPICHLSDLPGALLRREPYWSSSEADSSSSEEEFLDEINYPQQELLVYQDVVHIIPPPVALLDTLSICWDSQSCEYAHSLHDQLCHASWLLLRARVMFLSNARLVREAFHMSAPSHCVVPANTEQPRAEQVATSWQNLSNAILDGQQCKRMAMMVQQVAALSKDSNTKMQQIQGKSMIWQQGTSSSLNPISPKTRGKRAAVGRNRKTFYFAKAKNLSKSVEQCKYQQSVRNRRRRDESVAVAPIVSAVSAIRKKVAEHVTCGMNEVRNDDCVESFEQIGVVGQAKFTPQRFAGDCKRKGKEATTRVEVTLTNEDKEAAQLLSAVQVKYPQVRSRIPKWLRDQLPSCLPNGRLNRKLVQLKFWLLDNDTLRHTAGYVPALKVVSAICIR